jgi:hypothetical protein
MKSSLAFRMFSMTLSSSAATRRASSKRLGKFFSAFVHLAVLARILSSSLYSMSKASEMKFVWGVQDMIGDSRLEFRRDRGRQGGYHRWLEHLHRFLHKLDNIVNPLLIIKLRLKKTTLAEPMLRRCGWTYLHGFNTVGHGTNSSLWTPYRTSIEALVHEVENSGYRGQGLGATLAILLYLSWPGGSGAVRSAQVWGMLTGVGDAAGVVLGGVG